SRPRYRRTSARGASGAEHTRTCDPHAMGEPASDVVVVLSTFPVGDRAAHLARTLVDERLCACVNLVGGVQSFYHWEGAIEEQHEQLAIVKTTRGKAAALIARRGELHPYDVPEALVLPVVTGLPAYLAWVVGETSAP